MRVLTTPTLTESAFADPVFTGTDLEGSGNGISHEQTPPNAGSSNNHRRPPLSRPRHPILTLSHGAIANRTPRAEFTRELAATFSRSAREKLDHPGLRVGNPWDGAIPADKRARDMRFVLEKAYGQVIGHPALAHTLAQNIADIESGKVLTWVLYWNDQPVGTASLTLKANGTVEMCRAAGVPAGTRLPDESIMPAAISVGGLQLQRLADFLENPVSEGFYAIDAEMRMSEQITLENGEVVASGARVQGNNAYLSPQLLLDPKFADTHGDIPHIEGMVYARIHLNPTEVLTREVLHTPLTNTADPSRVSLVDFARVAYPHAFGVPADELQFVSESTAEPLSASHEVLDQWEDRYIIYGVEGSWTRSNLQELLSRGFEAARLVEFVVSNRPENIRLIAELDKLGMIVMGIRQGGSFSVNGQNVQVPTTFHFRLPRPNMGVTLRPITVSDQYRAAGFGDLADRQYIQWVEALERIP